MPRRDQTAVRKARCWLGELPLASTDIERHLQRLLALRAAEVIRPLPRRKIASLFTRLSDSLPPFNIVEYYGDPVLAIAAQGILLDQGIQHADLMALVSLYANALADDHRPEPELALVACLLRRCGFKVTSPEIPAKRAISSAAQLLAADRKQTLEICRLVTTLTACGTRFVDIGDIGALLPSLCLSYATDWDAEAVSCLLRTCAYIGKSKEPACQWALEWLLDQQGINGRFGLFAPEAGRMQHDVNDWHLYFYPTVGALWCLAEIHQPGFLLSDHGPQSSGRTCL